MEKSDAKLDNTGNANVRVTNAFLLGWSISEALGHLRKGTRSSKSPAPRAEEYAPRLVASTGEVRKATDAFLLSVERIVGFYRQFGFETGEADSPFSAEILALPPKARDWLSGKSPSFYSARDLRELLQAWSLQVWARLDADSSEEARALTAGMSLADTYWYMRPPARRPEKPPSEEDWRRLLAAPRLDVERSRLRGLSPYLPAYVAPVISRHLQSWSIGTELDYHDGRLVRTAGAKEKNALQPKDETNLQRALERQSQNWAAMLFGLREAKTYLLSSDRRQIAWGRWVGLFFILLATALFLVAAAGVVAYYLTTLLFPSLYLFLNTRQAGVSDWLAVVSILWTILIAVPVPIVLRAAYQFTRGAQKWLDDQLTIRFISRRTFIPWDHYMK